MVKAIGGPSQPQPLAKPAKKSEEPEQKPPAPAAPAPAKDDDRDSLTTSQGGVDSKVAFEATQRMGRRREVVASAFLLLPKLVMPQKRVKRVEKRRDQ